MSGGGAKRHYGTLKTHSGPAKAVEERAGQGQGGARPAEKARLGEESRGLHREAARAAFNPQA